MRGLSVPSATSGRLQVGDIAIHHLVAGQGAPAVLIHGLACGHRMWVRQRPLAGHHRLVLYDQRGHGLTDAPDDPARYSAGHLAADLEGLLDALRLGPAHLVGFSLGGGPAMALAARRPDLVKGLVLADVGSFAEDPWRLQWLAGRWAALAAAGDRDALVDEMLRGDFFKAYANASPHRRRHMRALIATHPLHGLRHTFERVLARRKPLFRSTGLLRSIRVPTLVLAGGGDVVCRRAAKLLASSIPGAELAWIAGAGHMTPLEAPDAFNALVAGFLARHP
jgi:pimeloyl-ACP methyl ester carboxylesterase